MADWIEETDEWAFRLMLVPIFPEKVTRPTRVCPLSISSLPTSCDRNDFIRSKLVGPTLPDSSSTKMMSVGQSVWFLGKSATAHYLQFYWLVSFLGYMTVGLAIMWFAMIHCDYLWFAWLLRCYVLNVRQAWFHWKCIGPQFCVLMGEIRIKIFKRRAYTGRRDALLEL